MTTQLDKALYRRTISSALFERHADGSWWPLGGYGAVGKLLRGPKGWTVYTEDNGESARPVSYPFRTICAAAREARRRV